jgi:CPA1 family monovalent cation:H+ antiporter
MKLFNIIAILLTLSAAFGYLNHRFIRLPITIGTMLISMALSVAIVVLGHFTPLASGIEEQWLALVRSIDFDKTLLTGMLGFLLFAGALEIELEELLPRKWEVLLLATVGTAMSTMLIGAGAYGIAAWIGLPLSLLYCLLFGALISPTDPIAVLGILRAAGVPKRLESLISGESLFNDGVGVVIFVTLLGIASGGADASIGRSILFFFREFGGGVLFGLALGWAAFLLLRSIDNYHVEVLITLALVTGGYALAASFHISGPIAMVIAGLLIGNHGRRLAMSERTRQHLNTFWELVDQVLNSLLFVLIGLEVLIVTLSASIVAAGLLAVVAALAARFVSIGIPLAFLKRKNEYGGRALTILTWGGLRGGIAVALALTLPRGTERDTIVAMTYIVVVFSILVQGITIRHVATASVFADKVRGLLSSKRR